MFRLFPLLLLAACTGTFNTATESTGVVARAAVVACDGAEGDTVRVTAWSTVNQDGCGTEVAEGALLEDCGYHAEQVAEFGCDTVGLNGAKAQMAVVAVGAGSPQGTVTLTDGYFRRCESDNLMRETGTALINDPPESIGEVTIDEDQGRFEIDIQDVRVRGRGVFCDLRGG